MEVPTRLNNRQTIMTDHETSREVITEMVQDQHGRDETPESGTAYHLSSKRLSPWQVATSMGVATGNASAEDTKIVIEGRLRESHKDPNEIQVITQDSVEGDGMLF